MQLAGAIMERGHSVEIASLDDARTLDSAQLPVVVHALGPPFLKYAYTPKLVPWLELNIGNYDAVIINGIWQFHSFAASRFLHQRGIPYVLFTHGMLDPWFKKR